MRALLCVSMLLLLVSGSFAQGIMWAKQSVGTGQNISSEMKIDQDGNLYVAGMFTGTVEETNPDLTTNGGSDIYLSKYSSAGDLLWVIQIGSAETETVGGLALTADGSAVYLSGMFRSTCYFGSYTQLTSQGTTDIFLAKINSDGTFAWVHNTGYGVSSQQFGAIVEGTDDEVLMIGKFTDDITFYGGDISLTTGTPGIMQGFIAKFDASGNTLWANMVSGNNSDNTLRTVTSHEGNFVITGMYKGEMNFDIGTVSNDGSQLDMYVYSVDPLGFGVWVRSIEGSGNDYLWRHSQNEDGDIYITGYFNSPSLTVDSTETEVSALAYTNKGNNDVFYAIYNPEGTLQSFNTAGNNSDDYAFYIGSFSNKMLILGSTTGTINFGSQQITSTGGTDAFIFEQNNGTFVRAIQGKGSSTEEGRLTQMSATGSNYFFAIEFYSDTLRLDNLKFPNKSTGKRDFVIARFGCFDSLSLDVTHANCLGNEGEITATPSAGSGICTYLWSNLETTQTITGLSSGWYKVTVTGTGGCQKVDSAYVEGLPSALSASIPVFSHVTIQGGTNGTATVSASGGVAPYLYNWTNGSTIVNPSNLDSRTHYVTVTDACSNTLVKSINIGQPSSLTDDVCNETFGTMSAYMYCDIIPNVQAYEYLIKDESETEWTVVTTTAWPATPTRNYITFTQAGFALEHSYNVRVRAKVSNVWTEYGENCSVTLSVRTTKLRDDFCDITSDDTQTIIYCDPVSNVQDYEWEFRCNDIGYYQTISNVWPSYPNRNYIRISYMPNIVKGYTYEVRVRAKMDGVWGNFGQVCTIYLETTRLTDVYCGEEFTSSNTTIYCNGISGAEDYEFFFSDQSPFYEATRATSDVWGTGFGYRNYLKLYDIPGLAYGQTYDVKVRAYVNGGWTTYGSICQLTLSVPLTQLRSDFCNTSQTLNTLIYCDQISSVQEYEFKFERPGFSATRTTSSVWPTVPTRNYLRINNIPGVTVGYTYDVQVRAKVGNVWGEYGTTCQITIPSSKDFVISSPEQTIVDVYPNPFNSSFTLLVDDPDAELFTAEIYDIAGKLLFAKELGTNAVHSLGNELQNGAYILMVKSHNTNQTFRLIKTQ